MSPSENLKHIAMMEWDDNNNNNNNNHELENHHQNQIQNQGENGNITVSGNENGHGGGGMLYVKVMTDEQLEALRKQIAVYATICEQLVEMHKTLSAQRDLAGAPLGSMYCDPLMASAGYKITARQRWTPTPLQLQILERIFDQGNGTPSKQKIKELTSELIQHGQISETNVYYWFQNRRARSKRKHMVASSNNAAELEMETEVDSSDEKKTEPETLYSQQNLLRAEDLCFQSPGISSELHFFGEDHSTGKMGIPGSYSLYEQEEDYGLAG